MPAVQVPPRTRRLDSLSKSRLGPRPKPAKRPAATAKPCCENPDIVDQGDGIRACRNCWTQIELSNIVAEVTFSEDSRGAATAQGGFIGDNARHAQTLGRGITSRVGGGERNKAQEVERNGRQALIKLCTPLQIKENVLNQAVTLYMLASESNFSAGRQTDEVIGACLYAACRRQSANIIMLIDISEKLQVNVFRLGEVYKDLCRELYLKSTGVGTQHLVEVESLVMKYCKQLQFGEGTHAVANDAVKIIHRMKRDWMVTGRHPAGLCGACIILAAGMNNYRRSVREVVFVAKVCDMTIMKRVQEFRRTKSAAMTVQQFREYSGRLKHQHDPPILYESELKKQKFEEKKRKRQEASVARDTTEAREVIVVPDDDSTASSRETSAASATPGPDQETVEGPAAKRQRVSITQSATPAATQVEPRRDAEGFVIPPLPASAQAAEQEEPQDRPKRGRRKKPPPEPIVITEDELADEAKLREEIEYVLNDEEVQDSRSELEKAKDEERAKTVAEQQRKAAADSTKARRQSEGITWWDDKALERGEELVSAEDLAAEFANDPEVINCELSDAERKAKEQIWVFNNEDWLRQQQEKKLIESVAKSAGRDSKGRKPGKGGKKRKRGKMGDGTTLAEATTPIETPADATIAMLEKHAQRPASKFLNYDMITKLFEHSPSTSTSASRPGSATPSTGGASRHRTPSTAGRADEQDSDSSASPTPAPRSGASRLQSPPTTQPVHAASTGPTPSSQRRSALQAPVTPPQTQAQARAQTTSGADEDEESEGEEDDYVQPPDELDYGANDGSRFGDDDDREDIGEDDYQRALDPTGNWAMRDGDLGDDDY